MEQCSLDVDVDDVVTGTLLSLNPEHPHIRIDRVRGCSALCTTTAMLTGCALRLPGMQPRLLLGRREDCDVRLADMRVSGHHCEVRAVAGAGPAAADACTDPGGGWPGLCARPEVPRALTACPTARC